MASAAGVMAMQPRRAGGAKTPGKPKGWRKWKRRLSRVFGGKKKSKGKSAHQVNENLRQEDARVPESHSRDTDDSPTSERIEVQHSDEGNDWRGWRSERRDDDSVEHSDESYYDEDHRPGHDEDVERAASSIDGSERSRWDEYYDDGHGGEEELNVEVNTSEDHCYGEEQLEPEVDAGDEQQDDLLESDGNVKCEPVESGSKEQVAHDEEGLEEIPMEDAEMNDGTAMATTDFDGDADFNDVNGEDDESAEEDESVELMEADSIEESFEAAGDAIEEEVERTEVYISDFHGQDDDLPADEDDNDNDAEHVDCTQEHEQDQESPQDSGSRESIHEEKLEDEMSIASCRANEILRDSFERTASQLNSTPKNYDISFILTVAEWCHASALTSVDTQLLITCIKQKKYELARLLATRLQRDHRANEATSSEETCAILDDVLTYCAA